MTGKKGKKYTQKEAQYTFGTPEANCGMCAHFMPPMACEIVEGTILPNMWCKYYHPNGGLLKKSDA